MHDSFGVPTNRTRITSVLIVGLTIALTAVWPQTVQAAKKRSNKNNAAAAAAAKKKAIDSIRAQVAAAQQVLAAAEAATGASQAELDAIRKRVSSIREAMDAAEDGEDELREDLREIESRVLKAQGTDSDYGKAQKRLEEARDEVAKGHNEPRVESDPDHLIAEQTIQSARRDIERAKAAALANDSEWKATSQQLRELVAKNAKVGQSNGGAMGRMSAAHELRDAQEIAANARAVIARGESQLRQLGATIKK